MAKTGSVRGLLLSLWSEWVELTYPRCCFLCGQYAEDAIACSHHALDCRLLGPRCRICRAELAPAIADEELCPECRARAPRWERLEVLCDYRVSRAVREWLLAFKHGGRQDLARPLAAFLARSLLISGAWTEGSVLVPVPLHSWRRLERGYDQARLLAEELASPLNARVELLLERTRYTQVQGAPGAAPRQANVEQAFRCRHKHLPEPWARRIWLVDDVVTSGATLNACALALRKAGARKVRALALARAGGGAS